MPLGLTREQINEYFCPILLALSVMFASLYTFHKPSAYVLGAVYLPVSVILFKYFDSLKQKKSGGLIYTLIFAVVFFISFLLLSLHIINYGFFAPMRWFYAQEGTEDFQPDLIAALFLGGGFFLISVIYYFTRVRFRTMGVMLCTMFPFFFFAKREDVMPDVLTTLIMLLFLAVIIHNRRISKTDRGNTHAFLQVDRAYIICISVFILITGTLTMAVKKPYYQSFLEKNSRRLNPFNMNLQGGSGYEELSEKSSPRNGQPSYNYEPLFYLETDSRRNEIFLRTKAYDIFDGEVWVNSENGDYYYYSRQMPEYSTDDIVSDMSALTNESAEGLYEIHSAHLYDEDFMPRYLPAPFGSVTDDRMPNALIYYKSSMDTSVMRATSFYYLSALDDSILFNEAEDALYEKAKEYGYSSSEYAEYLENSDTEEAQRLLRDFNSARAKYTNLYGVSERLKQLSENITKDAHSDIEKAVRLENYFKENGYSYSLQYVPEDNSVDYFVFESKTGYCAGYATAMTMMARASGLTARYVEGFAAFEKTDDGRMVIRDGYAHAFVEVYIPGAGWLTFDPTVSDYKNIPDSFNFNNLGFLSGLFSFFNRISVVIVIAVIVFVLSLSDRIKELFLRISLRFKPVNERIITLYADVLKTVGRSADKDFSSYTPDMLREYLSSERGAVPEKLISLFEKTAFGGYECTKEEYSEAYREYKSCYKFLRKTYKSKEQRIEV